MRSHLWAVVFAGLGAADYALVGCYASLALTVSLQSSDNFQLSLACTTTCQKGGYAIAAMLGKTCVCSNEAPSGSAASSSKCSTTCPGWPDENCGGSGFYSVYSNGDVSIDSSASSAAASNDAADTSASGASTGKTTSTGLTTSATSADTALSAAGTTLSAAATTLSAAATTSAAATATLASSTAAGTTSDTLAAASLNTPTTVVSVAVLTVAGKATTITQTTTPTETAASLSSSAAAVAKSSGLSTGAKAGIGVGCALAGIAIIGLVVLFLVMRRREEDEESSVNDKNFDPVLPVPVPVTTAPPQVSPFNDYPLRGPLSRTVNTLQYRSNWAYLQSQQGATDHDDFHGGHSRMSMGTIDDAEGSEGNLRIVN